MAYSIAFHGAPDQNGDAETFFLCSTGSWQRFGDWAESLPEHFDAVKALTAEGSYEGTGLLSEQLALALREHPPEAPVRATADALAEKMGVGDEAETATITDDEGDEQPARESAARYAPLEEGEDGTDVAGVMLTAAEWRAIREAREKSSK